MNTARSESVAVGSSGCDAAPSKRATCPCRNGESGRSGEPPRPDNVPFPPQARRDADGPEDGAAGAPAGGQAAPGGDGPARASGIAPPRRKQPDLPPRPTRLAMLRGWRRRCPACGAGPLMQDFLKVRPECPCCGEELSHHRADDGPAYLTVLIVGHVIAPVLFLAFLLVRPDPLILAAAGAIICVALSLYLLPRLKGAIVGLQWAKRLHGFGNGD